MVNLWILGQNIGVELTNVNPKIEKLKYWYEFQNTDMNLKEYPKHHM